MSSKSPPPSPPYFALPSESHGLGVLVIHAWWGLNAFFKQTCDRQAAELAWTRMVDSLRMQLA